jgi:hypothetical protein
MVGGFDRKDPNKAKDLIVMMLTATQTLLFIPPIEQRPTLTLKPVASPRTCLRDKKKRTLQIPQITGKTDRIGSYGAYRYKLLTYLNLN